METSQSNLIDINKLLHDKVPKFADKAPKFVIRYIQKLLHEKDVNDILTKYGDLYGLDFVNATIKDFNLTIVVNGIEHLTEQDRIVVASNHPLGGLDGIALLGTVGSARPNVVAPVNDFLLFIKNLKPLFIPVNKVGKSVNGNHISNIRVLNETFEGDRAICYFPFGLCSRKTWGGKVMDLEWRKSFVVKSKQTHRYVVPTHIDGHNTAFFYNLARLRKALHIKTNIEMAFLVDELFKQRNKTLTITFGKPISWELFDDRYSDSEWAMKLRDFSYCLGKDWNQDFDPNKKYNF